VLIAFATDGIGRARIYEGRCQSLAASAGVKVISPPPSVCLVGSARPERDAAAGRRPVAHAAC
jgi:hypothetical protein